tara:strand:+ start:295 stop:1860 length:1566 start_codon:yes stop_codon:yes gene_type:complete
MEKDPCWKDYEMIGTKKKNGKDVPNCVPKEEVSSDESADPIEESAEYEGRKVTLNKPFAGDSKKKRYVYVKNDKGNIIKLGFGDPNMEIKRDDPERLKAYRARHNCSDPGPKWKANYWSCKYWSSTPTSKLDEATTIHLPRKYMHAGSEMEDQVSDAIHKAAGSPKMHSIDFKFGVRFEVERDGKKDQKLTDILRKNLKEESTSFQTYLEGVERDRADLAISKELERDKERHDRMRDQADKSDASSSKSQDRRLANEDVSIPMYVQEAAYDGNIGMMELAKFYMKASSADKQKLQDAIKSKRFKDAWKMIEKVTGVKLKGAEFATEDVTERSAGSMFKHAVGKVIFSKEYENALKLMKDTGITAALASKRFKGVDARKLASMAEDMTEDIEEEVVLEYFTDAQIRKLKREYSTVDKVDPSGPTYKALVAMLDKMLVQDLPLLKKLADADIKFVSVLAKNRLNRTMKKEDTNTEEVAANSVAGGGVDMNPTGKVKWDKRSKFHVDHMFKRADGTKYKKASKE